MFYVHLDTKKYLYALHSVEGHATFAKYTDLYTSLKRGEVAVPMFEVHGPASLQRFENQKAGKVSRFDYALALGETAFLNHNEKNLSFVSSTGANLLANLISPSALTGFAFRRGIDNVGVFIGGEESYIETGDNNAQVHNWQYLTGVTFENSNEHRIYISIVADGGGFYHVNIYKAAARAAGDLIGHTANYNSDGDKAIVADNASGLGGYITITTRVGADVDIEVVFGYVYLRWQPMYHSIDEMTR
jgi:hypothetical protein